jgi:hypothetical protein
MSIGYFIPIVILPDDGKVVCHVWNRIYMLSGFCVIAHRVTLILWYWLMNCQKIATVFVGKPNTSKVQRPKEDSQHRLWLPMP